MQILITTLSLLLPTFIFETLFSSNYFACSVQYRAILLEPYQTLIWQVSFWPMFQSKIGFEDYLISRRHFRRSAAFLVAIRFLAFICRYLRGKCRLYFELRSRMAARMRNSKSLLL